MFTGIIEEVGTVVEAGEGTLRIRSPFVLTDAHLGDSIAINGVDLTVAEMNSESFFANLMPETYRRSNLGELRPGDLVNLERSVRPTDRLSGHIVRGVVEGVGTLTIVAKDAASFSVSLVQYTQEHTNLIRRRPGDRINIETDIIARYVQELVKESGLISKEQPQ